MSVAELIPADLKTFLATSLILALFVGSLSAWMAIWRAGGLTLNPTSSAEGQRSAWARRSARIAVVLAALWFGLHFLAKLVPTQSAAPSKLSSIDLLQVAVISMGLVVLLIALLAGDTWRSLGDFGLKWRPLGSQLRDGWFGFQLALIPMAVTMALSSPFRTRETQNPLLVMLGDSSEVATLVWIFVLAAIVAPLSEELIFRVILQGSLGQVMPARWTIPMVAVAFCSVHGTVDGLALLPLALVLGWFFRSRHSYLTVVVIHGLFNATMLILAVLTLKQ